MIDEVTARTPKITKRGVGSLRWQAGPWGALQRVDPSFNPYVHVGQLKLNTLCKGIKEGAKVALWEGRVHSCSLGGECRRREKFDSSAIGRQAVNSRLQFDLLQETINSRRFAQSTCSGRWCVALSYTWAEGLRPRRRVTVLRFGGPGMVRMQDKNKQEKKTCNILKGDPSPWCLPLSQIGLTLTHRIGVKAMGFTSWVDLLKKQDMQLPWGGAAWCPPCLRRSHQGERGDQAVLAGPWS